MQPLVGNLNDDGVVVHALRGVNVVRVELAVDERGVGDDEDGGAEHVVGAEAEDVKHNLLVGLHGVEVEDVVHALLDEELGKEVLGNEVEQDGVLVEGVIHELEAIVVEEDKVVAPDLPNQVVRIVLEPEGIS